MRAIRQLVDEEPPAGAGVIGTRLGAGLHPVAGSDHGRGGDPAKRREPGLREISIGEHALHCEQSLADQAYGRLIARLWDGALAAGQFVSMPELVDLLGLPLAPTREAVKRAEARDLVSVLPKRGVRVMMASAEATHDCLDLRAILEEEGARRLIETSAALPLDALRASHRAVMEAARRGLHADLPHRVIAVDLSLHDALATGLSNPVAVEVYRVNRDRIAVIRNARPFLPDRCVSAMEEHLAIIETLARRDARAAVEAIRSHHCSTLRWRGILA